MRNEEGQQSIVHSSRWSVHARHLLLLAHCDLVRPQVPPGTVGGVLHYNRLSKTVFRSYCRSYRNLRYCKDPPGAVGGYGNRLQGPDTASMLTFKCRMIVILNLWECIVVTTRAMYWRCNRPVDMLVGGKRELTRFSKIYNSGPRVPTISRNRLLELRNKRGRTTLIWKIVTCSCFDCTPQGKHTRNVTIPLDINPLLPFAVKR